MTDIDNILTSAFPTTAPTIIYEADIHGPDWFPFYAVGSLFHLA